MKNSNSSHTDLTQGSISKILITLAIPIIITNMMHVVYNLTDTFWVGKLGEGAVDAVAVTNNVFPLVWFIASVSGGLGSATTVLISHFTGHANTGGVRKVIGQVSAFLSLFSLFFLLVAFFAAPTLIDWLGTPEAIKANAIVYLQIVMSSMVFMLWFGLFQSLSHARGNSVIPMKIQLSSVLINVVLDPILIFGLVGFGHYGVIGAAYATFVARLVSAGLGFYFFYTSYRDLLPRFSDFKPDYRMLKQIIRVGVPSSFSQGTTSFGFLILQRFVNNYGTVICSAYALNNRFVGIFLIPAMGVNNAMISVIGQNIGAGKIDRAEKSVWVAFRLVFMIMGLGALVLFFFGGELTRIFINNDEVVRVTTQMFRIVAVSALLCALMFIFNSSMDGAGHTMLTSIVSIIRLWCIRIPFAYLLSGYFIHFSDLEVGPLYHFLNFFNFFPKAFSYNGLWWAMFASNLVGLIWSYMLFKGGRWKIPVIKLDKQLF